MNAPKTAPKASGSYLFVSICIVLLSLLICLLVGWLAGSVHGEEFDVVSWDVRSFSFVRNPLTGQQITNIQHVNLRSGVDATILPHLMGGPLSPKGSRWDLLFINRGGQSGIGDARIFLDYIGGWGTSSDLYWSEWTVSHPVEAPFLWSAVRDTVHLARYEKLPDLFEAARGNPTVAELKPMLAAIMLPVTLEESKAALKAGDAALSQAIAKQGLTYGANPELKALAGGGLSADAASSVDGKAGKQ